jgi:hypothetical protein
MTFVMNKLDLARDVLVDRAEVAMNRLMLLAVVIGAWPVGNAMAEPEEGPGRGVARISVVNGDVSVRRGDSGDWVAAAVNSPVIVPDSVFVGGGSRAEVQLDYANLVRLGMNTEVRFSELETRRYQLQIARGTVTFSVLRDSDADIDLSTPNVSVRPARKGSYRVHVLDDGTTEITVRSGQAEIFTPRGAETLRAGRTMLVRGTASEPEFQMAAAIPRDEWDNWNEQRDRELSRSGVYRYVSRDIYGAEDLDTYGRWVYAPPYGWVWAPYVAAGWAPYRYGRWSWLDYYGWTWIGYDPWGWAPYHYGRWFHHGPYGWCWWPGGFHTRHYWRPALVAFFGWGGHSGFHFGFGVGFGRIGWVPLGPYERYHPWYGPRYYRGGRTYVDNSVNIVNNINITNIYRNARIHNGITAVDSGDFGRGRVANVHRASSEELRRVNLVRGEVPVVPQRESLRFADRQVRAENLPVRTRDSFAGRFQARQPERVPFSEQQQRMERVARRVYEQQQSPRAAVSGRAVQNAEPGAGNRGAARESAAEPAPRGWRSAGEPREAGTGVSAGESWRRFGEASRSQPEARTFSPAGEGAAREPAGRGAEPASPRAGGSRSAEQSSGWRRFGEPTRARPEREAPPPSASQERLGTGRTLGTRGAGPSRIENSPSAGTGGWESFGRGSVSGSRDRGASSQYESQERPSRSMGRGVDREAVPISPPIIRERSSPRVGGSPSRSGGGSSGDMSPSPRWSGGGRSDAESPGRSGGGVFSGGPRSGGGEWMGGAPRGGGDSSPRSGGSRRSR